VPYLELPSSALAPGTSPVRVHYRDAGGGRAIVILHGGWGYEIYPFERQIAALAVHHRVVVPDRTGYGQSGRIERQATDFHHRAAAETFALIDALALDRPIVWGHSDGAVIALLMGLLAPERVKGLIAESTHFFRNKPSSRRFFETMRDCPEELGGRIAGVLAHEHGDDWRQVIAMNAAAWLRLAELGGDLYEGRLSELRVPALVLHGDNDPRTEPGELNVLRNALLAANRAAFAGQDFSPAVHILSFPGGGHSPHTAPETADAVTRAAVEFVAALGLDPGIPSGRQ